MAPRVPIGWTLYVVLEKTQFGAGRETAWSGLANVRFGSKADTGEAYPRAGNSCGGQAGNRDNESCTCDGVLTSFQGGTGD